MLNGCGPVPEIVISVPSLRMRMLENWKSPSFRDVIVNAPAAPKASASMLPPSPETPNPQANETPLYSSPSASDPVVIVGVPLPVGAVLNGSEYGTPTVANDNIPTMRLTPTITTACRFLRTTLPPSPPRIARSTSLNPPASKRTPTAFTHLDRIRSCLRPLVQYTGLP